MFTFLPPSKLLSDGSNFGSYSSTVSMITPSNIPPLTLSLQYIASNKTVDQNSTDK